MGRFDELTQLEEKLPKAEKASMPESIQTVKPTSTLVHKYTNPQVEKPPNGFVVKPTKRALPQPINEKPQKYTTHLQPDMVKKIKIFAVQQDIKDYEVVEKALTEYFERNK
jgi:hypothetical protein